MFSYRHRILQNDLKLWGLLKENKGKRILISGSTGLIGSALIPLLETAGEHKISRLVRPTSKYSRVITVQISGFGILKLE